MYLKRFILCYYYWGRIYLKEKIRTIFNLGRFNCKVSWKDEDCDDVAIETNEELLIAFQELQFLKNDQ